MKIEKFEDIESWRKARELTKEIYRATSNDTFQKDWALQNQIRRATVSVMSGIAEGFERGGNKEFRQFLSIAKGSAGEVKSQLYVAMDVGYLKRKEFERLYLLTDETSRLIGGFIRYLKQSDRKGTKFK